MTDAPVDVADQPAAGLPRWFAYVVLAVLIAAHTQATLRHVALRLAGVRYGVAEKVVAGEDGGTIVHDEYGVYKPNALAGKSIFFGDASFPVTGNTATTILVDAPLGEVEAAVGEHRKYLTGFSKKNALVKLALKVPGIGFTPSEVLLGLGLALLGLWLLRDGRWRQCRWPLPLIIFVGIGALSIVGPLRLLDSWPETMTAAQRAAATRQGLKSGIKELIQYVEVFVLAYAFFVGVLRDRRVRRYAVAGLAAMAGVVIIVGLIEYVGAVCGWSLRGLLDIGEVDATFGFRFNPSRSSSAGSESSKNILATYLLVMSPFLLALATGVGCRWKRAGLVVLAALGLCLTLGLPQLLCAIAGCIFVASLCRWRPALPAVLVGTVAVLGLWMALSQQHGRILLDSMAVHRRADPYGLLPMPVKGRDEKSLADWEPWQQKHIGRQAVLNAISYSPLLGHGLGMYQARINSFYEWSKLLHLWYPKSARNFMEKDAHGLYFVLATEVGVLGVAALLWLLVSLLRQSVATRSRASDPLDRAMLLGVGGALIALVLACWSASFLVRGLQLIVIALMALPAAIASDQPTADDEPV